MASEKKIVMGKKSRASGARFEVRVRGELEKLGWIISKWMNTVDDEREGKMGKLVPAKRKYNPFNKALTLGTGFPDFVCFRKKENDDDNEIPNTETDNENYEVIGLEVKKQGYLDKREKWMCRWLLDNKVFSRILIAKQGKKRGEVEYIDFSKRYDKVQ